MFYNSVNQKHSVQLQASLHYRIGRVPALATAAVFVHLNSLLVILSSFWGFHPKNAWTWTQAGHLAEGFADADHFSRYCVFMNTTWDASKTQISRQTISESCSTLSYFLPKYPDSFHRGIRQRKIQQLDLIKKCVDFLVNPPEL